MELLISAFVLSAFQLHARFVIHVNPHPPLASRRKQAAVHVKEQESGAAEAATAQTVDLQPESARMTEVSDARSTGEPSLTLSEQIRIEHDAIADPVTEAASPIAVQPHTNGKTGKKQKYRKAG